MDAETAPPTNPIPRRRELRSIGAPPPRPDAADRADRADRTARAAGRPVRRFLLRVGLDLLPRVIAVLVALGGLGLIIAGALEASVLAPPAVRVATLYAPDQPVVSTAVGVLGLGGPRVRIEARAGASTPVFLGIGRAGDVEAYLAQVSRREVIGYDAKNRLVTKQVGSQAGLPDPAGADVWVLSSRGAGSAALSWPSAPGQWLLVAATDGSAPAPDSLRLAWSGQQRQSPAPALISVGLVLLVAGAITLVMLVTRSRLQAGQP